MFFVFFFCCYTKRKVVARSLIILSKHRHQTHKTFVWMECLSQIERSFESNVGTNTKKIAFAKSKRWLFRHEKKWLWLTLIVNVSFNLFHKCFHDLVLNIKTPTFHPTTIRKTKSPTHASTHTHTHTYITSMYIANIFVI